MCSETKEVDKYSSRFNSYSQVPVNSVPKYPTLHWCTSSTLVKEPLILLGLSTTTVCPVIIGSKYPLP